MPNVMSRSPVAARRAQDHPVERQDHPVWFVQSEHSWHAVRLGNDASQCRVPRRRPVTSSAAVTQPRIAFCATVCIDTPKCFDCRFSAVISSSDSRRAIVVPARYRERYHVGRLGDAG
jgi:hypothetical protein